MRTRFSHGNFTASKYIYFVITLIFITVFQIDLWSLWAEEKYGKGPSLSETIKLALDYNSQRSVDNNFLPPENVIFLVKKYYYQIQAQVEQLDTAKKVRDHFQKAVDKSEKILEEGEGDVSQFDLTKLKLGLSGVLNDIIGLQHDVQIAKLQLGELIGKELGPDSDIAKIDITPAPFSYDSFNDYLQTKNLSPSSKNLEGKINVTVGKASTKISLKLGKRDKLTLHKAFATAKEAKAKVMLGKKNRKITRALLVAEVANHDFGIGDSQNLFEALIIYTRVLSGYLDSIYTLNVAVAELEKLAEAIYK